MARFIAQIIVAGAQVVVRAFTRAVRQEMAASQEAARRMGSSKPRSEQIGNLKLGLSLEEAKQILNIRNLDKDEINRQYEFLFKANDKERGGSFYLQSKIVRAKERLDLELQQSEAKTTQSPEADSKT